MRDEAVSAAEDQNVPVATGPRRGQLNQQIRHMLIGVFMLDAGVLFVTSVLAWYWKDSIDKYWAEPPFPFPWAPTLGPIEIVLWLVTLLV